MIFTKKNEGKVYEAAGHDNMWGAIKVKEGDSLRTTVSLSHFLPNGSAEMKSSPKERVYFLISGSITVTSDNEEHILSSGDLIYIAPNENRQISVNNNEPAAMLVIIVTP